MYAAEAERNIGVHIWLDLAGRFNQTECDMLTEKGVKLEEDYLYTFRDCNIGQGRTTQCDLERALTRNGLQSSVQSGSRSEL